jgi:2-oxoglutarate ferredoxin oxidoreductase subunit gamma
VERELVITGIGGQGVQLAAQVLARAAMHEGREVQLFGSYGGMMRGGNTDATLVVGDDAIAAPPTVGSAWSAIVMHHDHSGPILARLRPGSLVLVNASVVEPNLDRRAWQVVEVAATDLAIDVGNVMTASMVMVGAYIAATDLVALESASAALGESLPSYRSHHVALNEAALRSGFAAVPRAFAPAWGVAA